MEAKTLKSFKDFNSRELHNGVQYLHFYPNGYGVSIIKHDFSYGQEDGKWEMAVLEGSQNNWSITYDTPITNYVLGHLSDSEVNEICQKVSELKKATE